MHRRGDAEDKSIKERQKKPWRFGTIWWHLFLMPLKVREVIRLLEKHGWIKMRSKGSHRQFKHPSEAHVITVPGNEGTELAPGTLKSILKRAGLK